MILKKYFSNLLLTFSLAAGVLILTPTPVSAACDVAINAHQLSYNNIDGKNIDITTSGQAILDTLSEGEVETYVSAIAPGCNQPTQYDFLIAHCDTTDFCGDEESDWNIDSETGWQSANSATLKIDSGVRRYGVNLLAWSQECHFEGLNWVCQTDMDEKWIDFFYMDINQNFTIQKSELDSDYLLNGIITVPHYQMVMGPEKDGYMPTYYLLIGEDASIRTNRSLDEREIQIPADRISWDNETGAPLWRITLSIANYEIPNLEPGKTYYFRLRQQGTETAAYIPGVTFTTSTAPAVTTQAAEAVTGSSAALKGTADPNGHASYSRFYISSTPGDCSTFTTSHTGSPRELGSGTEPVSFSTTISGLTAETTYYYCAAVDYFFGGEGMESFGNQLTFKTLALTLPRSDDSSQESQIYVDSSDDMVKKTAGVSAEGIESAKLWVYGRGYGDHSAIDARKLRLKVNGDHAKSVRFDPIKKFGTSWSWQSFDIPIAWLQVGGNNTFEITDPSSWTVNNLEVGLDTNATSQNSHAYYWNGEVQRCLNLTGSPGGRACQEFLSGELMMYLEITASTCTGNINLTLNPSTTATSGAVAMTASGIAGCERIIRFREGVCETAAPQVSSCESTDDGCIGNINAPSTAGSYTYYACIDKNNDGDVKDTGEGSSRATLTVTPAPSSTPTPAPAPTPAPSSTPTPAPTDSCGTGDTKATGLVTTPSLSDSNFPTSGGCIIDPKTSFAPFKIPTFEDLKSLYYDQK